VPPPHDDRAVTAAGGRILPPVPIRAKFRSPRRPAPFFSMPPTTPEPPEPSAPPPRPRLRLRYRSVAAWTAACALALLLIGLAGQWAAVREANFQADSIRRAMEVHVLGLRDAAGKYSYLPFTASLHPDVLAALAHPQDAAVKQRANRYIEEVNRQAGSDALYLIDLQGLTLAASNWATPQSFVGESYANRPYFRPYKDVTRGQLSKITSGAAGWTATPTAQTFEDVPPGSTFSLWIERMAARGIIGGYPCGGGASTEFV